MPSNSTYRALVIPSPGGDEDQWGTELVAQADALDAILGGALQIASSAYGTAATLTSSQTQNGFVFTTGSPGADFGLNLASQNGGNGLFVIQNAFSDGSNLTVMGSSGDTGVTIPSGSFRIVLSHGGYASFADSVLASPFPMQTAIEFAMDGGQQPPTTGRKPGILLPFTFQVQGWQINCADSSAASISLNFEANYGEVSGAGSLGFSDNTTGSGTTSGWGATEWSSGAFLSVNINSAATGTKFTAAFFGNRLT